MSSILALGKWWGTHPLRKAQEDIDILGLSTSGEDGLFCECKYRNRPLPMQEYEDVLSAAEAFPNVMRRYFVFFSKDGYTQSVIERARREGTVLLHIKDLYSLDEAAWRRLDTD